MSRARKRTNDQRFDDLERRVASLERRLNMILGGVVLLNAQVPLIGWFIARAAGG